MRAEQRRRLRQLEREQESKLLEIQLKKLDVYRDIQESIKSQRPNALLRTFKESFGSNDGFNASSPVLSTPGPGEYEVGTSAHVIYPKTKGGYMAGRVRKGLYDVSPNDITPGPGEYEPNELTNTISKLKKSSNGVVPFQGRGKTDVDWLIHEAQKRPGPGYYNTHTRDMKGGKFSKASLPSMIEHIIETKKMVPGPGAYEDPTCSRVPKGLKSIGKTHNISVEENSPIFHVYN